LVGDDGSWSADVEYLARRGTTFHETALVRDGEVVMHSGASLPGGVDVLRIDAAFGSNARPSTVLSLDRRTRVITAGSRILFQTGERLHVQGLPADATLSDQLLGHVSDYGADADTLVGTVTLTSGEQAIVRVELSAVGATLSRTADLVIGQSLPDGSRVTAIQISSEMPVNGRSEWLCVVTGDDGEKRLVTPGAVRLRTGTSSPVPGRTLVDFGVHLANDDLGGYATVATLSGDPASDELLVKNGVALAQEGEVLPGLAPGALAAIGHLRMDGSGALVWWARTYRLYGNDTALMRDREPLLIAGVSTLAGQVIEEVHPNFHSSPNGRFLLGSVTLVGFPHSYLVRIDLGSAVPLRGCTPNPATLRSDAGLVLAGRAVELVLDGPAPLGSLARVHLALGSAGPLDCGRPTPFGELFLDPAALAGVLPGGTFASAPVRIPLAIPADTALVDLALVAQGSFAHPNGVVLTNGLALTIGAP
jgi:hypothetical protein